MSGFGQQGPAPHPAAQGGGWGVPGGQGPFGPPGGFPPGGSQGGFPPGGPPRRKGPGAGLVIALVAVLVVITIAGLTTIRLRQMSVRAEVTSSPSPAMTGPTATPSVSTTPSASATSAEPTPQAPESQQVPDADPGEHSLGHGASVDTPEGWELINESTNPGGDIFLEFKHPGTSALSAIQLVDGRPGAAAAATCGTFNRQAMAKVNVENEVRAEPILWDDGIDAVTCGYVHTDASGVTWDVVYSVIQHEGEGYFLLQEAHFPTGGAISEAEQTKIGEQSLEMLKQASNTWGIPFP